MTQFIIRYQGYGVDQAVRYIRAYELVDDNKATVFNNEADAVTAAQLLGITNYTVEPAPTDQLSHRPLTH